MKNRTAAIWKRYKKGVVCVLAGILLVQSCYMTEAEESAAALKSISENTVEESFSEEVEGERQEVENALRESETQGTDDLRPGNAEEETSGPEEKDFGETVSENSISGNSVSENSAECGMPEEAGGLTETMEEQTVPETTAEESVSENSAEESVSENTTESVSENSAEESISENSTAESENMAEESVSENSTEESASENITGESVSENTTQDSVSENTMRVDGMSASADGSRASVPPTAPVIKSVVPKDTTAQVRFTHLLEGEQSAGIMYEIQLTDEVSGAKRTLSGKEAGVVTAGGYDGKMLNTFQIGGLSVNRKYSVILQAKYGDGGEPVSSAKEAFTTKKDMIATGGTMKVRYADMEALKGGQKPAEVPETGVAMKAGDSCALYAQVSRLMRAVEKDKLKWTVTPIDEESPKNGLKVKAGKSTYEAVLTAQAPGTYQVTATSTLSKETAVQFQVTIK